MIISAAFCMKDCLFFAGHSPTCLYHIPQDQKADPRGTWLVRLSADPLSEQPDPSPLKRRKKGPYMREVKNIES